MKSGISSVWYANTHINEELMQTLFIVQHQKDIVLTKMKLNGQRGKKNERAWDNLLIVRHHNRITHSDSQKNVKEEIRMMFAIRNKKTKRWMYGTDHRYFPPHQRTADDRVMIFPDRQTAELAMRARRCNANYEAVAVRVDEVKEE